MQRTLSSSTFLCCFLLALNAAAQLQISFPISRAVYQRNNANTAVVNISGTYTVQGNRVDARAVARETGKGTSTDWQVIVNNAQGGVFSGALTLQGGWYDLEIRLMRDGQQVATTRVERVGVGEVFVIAGQSNAGNTRVLGQVLGESAQDDRVNCVDYQYPPLSYPNDPPLPVFTKVENPKSIAPRGIGPWCWGRLGDLLASRLNVPILFFNGSFEGTSVKNWAETATGLRTKSLFSPPGGPDLFYEDKHPYYPLQLSLQYYANMLGCRAVLWHQGEGDNFFRHTQQQYVGWLNTVITQTRTDYNPNLPWVVSRVSYADFSTPQSNTAILAAQNQVIATTPNVYAGPNTDLIQIPRGDERSGGDGVHFNRTGLPLVADAWNASLNNAFFANSQPIMAAAAPAISVACAANNALAITVSNYDNVRWSSGETARTVTKGGGTTIRATVLDSRGNKVFTPTITVGNTPSIQAIGETTFCQGNSVMLSSNFQQGNNWSSGQTDQRITVNTSGDYQVRFNDASGCTFTSNTIRVTANPIPTTPTVANERPTTFCQGDNTVLVSSQAQGLRYNWSNGQTDPRLTITQGGSYNLTVTDQNGCTSSPSAAVNVTVNPVPATPQISTNGRTVFCANESITLNSTEGPGYRWSNGQTDRNITINQSGAYTVQAVNQFNCASSASNVINVTVNPLPARPVITSERPTTFCQGESTVLVASQGFRYNWNNGNNDQRLTTSQPGSFSLTVTDQNGCTSPNSAVVDVVVNPLPATPIIIASGRTTICANEVVTLTSTEETGYQWSSGQATRSVNINQTGAYSIRTRNQFNCTSAPSNTINVLVNPLPDPPIISARGSLTFCEGGQLVLQTNSPLRTLWSAGDSTQTLTIRASGTYTARVRDGNGCVSPTSNSLTAQVLPRPQPPTVQRVGTYLLQASGAPANERYFWRRDTDSLTAGTALLRINRSGQYSVRTQITYSPTLACFSLPSSLLTYELPTDNQDLSVYPNPNPDGIFLLETLADLSNATVTVYTLAGQLVFRSAALNLNERKQIQLEGLAPGPYILNVTAGDFKVSKRIQIGMK
jgi:hypothetical protein